MKLGVLSREDLEQARLWRNESPASLRTPYLLTKEQQERFYADVICNRDARARYWSVIRDNGLFIGMTGLENIEYENRRAEISIIIDPKQQGTGYGEEAADLLLEQGFDYMNIENIWGECYGNNPATAFWKRIISKYCRQKVYSADSDFIWLDRTKYWEGKYWNSLWFNITKTDWEKRKVDLF